MTIVWGAGRTPNSVMLVGEAPGKSEAAKGEPFVGKSGHEQQTYLSRYQLTARAWYRTNVCKEYIPKNPDPTPEQIDEYTFVNENSMMYMMLDRKDIEGFGRIYSDSVVVIYRIM